MQLHAFILLYNKNILESVTYNSIKDQDVNLIVFDNSTSDYDNEADCKKLNITYLTKNQNVGLSKAYNIVFESLKQDGYLMMFDDDTIINNDYFKKVKSTILENPDLDILVPQVISAHNQKIYSPRVTRKRIHAINSGLVISHNIYQNYQYPEKLFLYFADLQFFNDNKEKKIKIIDVQIEQNFSEFVDTLTPGVYHQFQMRIDDAKHYFSWYKYYPYLIIFVLQKSLWFKTSKLLGLIFKNLNKGS